MYIVFNKDTKRAFIVNEKPIKLGYNMELAEYYGEIPKNDYLTVTNLREETVTWIETKTIEKLDENGESIFNENGEIVNEEITEEKSRTYLVCDLVANFYPPKTEEQLASEKQKKYKDLCEKYIREKYSASDEFQILREYNANPEDYEAITNFDAYNEYVENCLIKAKIESNR